MSGSDVGREAVYAAEITLESSDGHWADREALDEDFHRFQAIMSEVKALGDSEAGAEEVDTAKRQFVLTWVQPGLAGLMDGSVSTLAPIFATAFATHDPWTTFLVGLAASVGAGISMGFTEAASDDGELSGRGSPWRSSRDPPWRRRRSPRSPTCRSAPTPPTCRPAS